jgi:hypothetical protein
MAGDDLGDADGLAVVLLGEEVKVEAVQGHCLPQDELVAAPLQAVVPVVVVVGELGGGGLQQQAKPPPRQLYRALLWNTDDRQRPHLMLGGHCRATHSVDRTAPSGQPSPIGRLGGQAPTWPPGGHEGAAVGQDRACPGPRCRTPPGWPHRQALAPPTRPTAHDHGRPAAPSSSHGHGVVRAGSRRAASPASTNPNAGPVESRHPSRSAPGHHGGNSWPLVSRGRNSCQDGSMGPCWVGPIGLVSISAGR